MKRIVVLGSTGSIGTQTLDVVRRHADKLEVVVTFLAVLELMKIGKIHLSQEETFGDMDIETLEQEGEEEELDLAQLGDFEG